VLPTINTCPFPFKSFKVPPFPIVINFIVFLSAGKIISISSFLNLALILPEISNNARDLLLRLSHYLGGIFIVLIL